jgi:hypothetical protein
MSQGARLVWVRLAAVVGITGAVLLTFSAAEGSAVATAAATVQEGSCHQAYSPCLPIVEDLNCSDLSDSQKPVTILRVGFDPYHLDNDWTTATFSDGIGCEEPAPAATTTIPALTTTAPPSTTTPAPTTTSPTTTTTTVATQVQGTQQLARTGASVALLAILGLVLVDAGYVTGSSGWRARIRRSKR